MTPMLSRRLILMTLCLCAFAVNLDVTLVNVTLPRLVVDLGASTRDLQWIVDAYTLTFAALVLASGTLADRFGRREALLVGLVVYAVGNGLAALTTTTGALIATRAVMGLGAAIIFPTTLSILTNVFTERRERAQAIGLWGAVTGVAIALGPIVGGALLQSASWQATFLIKVPLAIVVGALVLWVVPTSRDPETPPVDRPGLVLSTAAVAALVFTIIEAPGAGWATPRTLGGFVAAVALAALFARHERRIAHPMVDLGLFANRRFSAASLSVTISFFALGGFIFLIIQYFQFLKGYGPLETGVRLLPVATSVAVGSVLGTALAVRRGTKLVVTAGLGLLTCAYAWISGNQVTTSYLEIAGQMVVLGTGMGLTSAPATESIMGAVQRTKAGVGSAINDATRELGGTLGVAIIGSVYASLYGRGLSDGRARGVPSGAATAARDSIGAALTAAGRLSASGAPGAGSALRDAASSGFFDGLRAGCLVAAGVCAVGAVLSVAWLPAQPPAEAAVPATATPRLAPVEA